MSYNRGFTLVEILITLLIMSLVTVGAGAFFTSNKRVAVQEDIDANLEANLRIGITRITDTLRNGGYGVPDSDITTWIPWVSGFTGNPDITPGTGSNPDVLSVAGCTSIAVMTLSSAAAAAATTLSVSDTGPVNTGDQRLILIDEFQHAHVTAVDSGAGTIDIDTDPLVSGNQGLLKGFPAGTTICRVDVESYDVDTTANVLRRNRNQGGGAQSVVDEIENLQIQTVSAGRQYRITLSARSSRRDPATGAFATRSMNTTVTLKN